MSVKTDTQVADLAPVAMPRSARYLGQVEWSWSPMHMRIDAYYLSMCGHHRHWVLWVKGYDDIWSRWMAPEASMVVPRCGLTPDAAARLLLMAYWAEQRQQEVDRFHWVNEDGELDAGELTEIATAVWGAKGEGEESGEGDGEGL